MKLWLVVLIKLCLLIPSLSHAVTANGQYCYGKIKQIIKWSNHTESSVLFEGSQRYFKLPSAREETIALTAYAMGKDLKISWRASSGVTVTDCVTDWPQYKVLDGFMVIE